MQTIKRNWLKSQVEAGKIEAKCDFHFIDGLPDATQGRTDWMLARIRRPRYERIQYDDGTQGHERCIDNKTHIRKGANYTKITQNTFAKGYCSDVWCPSIKY